MLLADKCNISSFHFLFVFASKYIRIDIRTLCCDKNGNICNFRPGMGVAKDGREEDSWAGDLLKLSYIRIRLDVSTVGAIVPASIILSYFPLTYEIKRGILGKVLDGSRKQRQSVISGAEIMKEKKEQRRIPTQSSYECFFLLPGWLRGSSTNPPTLFKCLVETSDRYLPYYFASHHQ